MSQGTLRFLQIIVAAAVGCGAIYVDQQIEYGINPAIIGAWAFMAAYGVTLLINRFCPPSNDDWSA